MRPIALAYSLPELVIPMRPLWLTAGVLLAVMSLWLGTRRIGTGNRTVLAAGSVLCLMQGAGGTAEVLTLSTLTITAFGATLCLGLVATGWAIRQSAAALGQAPDRALACFLCSAALGLFAAQAPIFAEYFRERQQPLQAEWLPTLGISVAALTPIFYFRGEGSRGRQWLDAVSPCALALGGLVHFAAFFFSGASSEDPGRPFLSLGSPAIPLSLALYLSGGAWLFGCALLWHGPRRRFFGQSFLIAVMAWPGLEYCLRWLHRQDPTDNSSLIEFATVGLGFGLASLLWRRWSASPLPPRAS